MLFEDQVLGVLVLSKLGLRQFRDGRPAAPRDLRELRRPGHGQRRRDPAAAREVGRPRAEGPRPARAAPDHRIDPHHARPARSCWARSRTGSGSSSAPTTWRSSWSTGFAAGSRRSSPAASMPSTTCRPGIPARPASRHGSWSTTSPCASTTSSTTSASLQPPSGPHPRQPRVRAAARARGRDRRAHARAHRRGPDVQRRRVRARAAVRRTGVHRAPERRGPSRRPATARRSTSSRACSITGRSASTSRPSSPRASCSAW